MKTFSQFLTESEKMQVHVSMSKKLNATEKKSFDRVLDYYDAKVSSETDKGVVVQFTTPSTRKPS